MDDEGGFCFCLSVRIVVAIFSMTTHFCSSSIVLRYSSSVFVLSMSVLSRSNIMILLVSSVVVKRSTPSSIFHAIVFSYKQREIFRPKRHPESFPSDWGIHTQLDLPMLLMSRVQSAHKHEFPPYAACQHRTPAPKHNTLCHNVIRAIA